MTKLFEKVEGFPLIRWAEGFAIGIIIALIVSMMLPDPKPNVVRVPVVQVVEKQVPVIVKKAVYLSRYDKSQIQCLAENAYFEAGNQSTKGKIAVTNVVMNRVDDKRFPKTPCGVVHQKARGVCQFSWVCEGKKHTPDAALFARARKVAEDVYLGNVGDVTSGAKFYHANYVNPRWRLERVKVIGAHIFYRG